MNIFVNIKKSYPELDEAAAIWLGVGKTDGSVEEDVGRMLSVRKNVTDGVGKAVGLLLLMLLLVLLLVLLSVLILVTTSVVVRKTNEVLQDK